MSLWTRIKHAFTRSHRPANEAPQMWVRWYSRQSCQWSKGRRIPQDWMSSDHEPAYKMSSGQRFEITNVLPEGARIKKGHA